MQKLDRYEIIWRAIQNHGYKFDYRDVSFNRLNDDIELNCPIHGKFKQKLYKHLKGRGCPKCGIEKVKKKITLSFDEVIKKSKELYRIDFKIKCNNYKDTSLILEVTCPLCGKTKLIECSKFLLGRACSCRTNHLKCNNLVTFQEKLNIISNNQFKCLEYNGNCKEAVIKCLKCGDIFKIKPNLIYQILKCKNCEKNKLLDIKFNDFVRRFNKIHKNRYKYVKPKNEIKLESYITAICPLHGEFNVNVKCHLNGNGCPKCFKNEVLTKDEFIKRAEKIYGKSFVYNDVVYINNKTKVIVQCSNCGFKFYVRPDLFLSKGITKCPNENKSFLEFEIENFLEEHNMFYISQYNAKWLGKLRIDFYLPKYNIGIECQGLQHFKSVKHFGGDEGLKRTIKRDNLKRELCEKNGVKLLYYSNLGIDYPYKVFEDKNKLLEKIINNINEINYG